jgi:enterochelin esterase family protein
MLATGFAQDQPAGPPAGRRMPAMPKPGPHPLPTLAALPSHEDKSFYVVRDVPHGKVEAVNYTNFAGDEKRMHIYLPPGYAQNPDRRYPVLYLNHGGGDDDSKWSNTGPDGGHAQNVLDNLIADGKAKPMIVVMPNTRGLAAADPPPVDGDDNCTKEYVQNIIPYVDGHYRTLADRNGRALAGLSMGGFVVMHTGLSRLDTFSELYVYSSGHFPNTRAKFEERFKSLFEDPATNQKFNVPMYFASGETDIALLNGQGDLAIVNRYGLRNFWVLSTGGHDWANWRRYLWQTAQIMFPGVENQ